MKSPLMDREEYFQTLVVAAGVALHGMLASGRLNLDDPKPAIENAFELAEAFLEEAEKRVAAVRDKEPTP